MFAALVKRISPFWTAVVVILLLTGLVSPTVYGREREPADSWDRAEQWSVPIADQSRDFRAWAVFGLTTATGFAAHSLSLGVAALGGNDTPNDLNFHLANGFALAIAPGAGAALSHLVTRRSEAYESPVQAMMLGGYVGAGLAFVGSYLFLKSDDPTVDGQYETGYFDESTHNWRAAGSILFCYLIPVFAPALGASLGYVWGRTPKERTPLVSLAPPTPILFKSRDREGKPKHIPGLNLLQMTF